MRLSIPFFFIFAAGVSAQPLVPFARYSFEEGSGVVATDTGSRGSIGNGTLYGNPVWVNDPNEGGGLRFDGINDYVTAPIGMPVGATAYTIRARLMFDNRNSWATIVKNWGSTTVGAFHFGLNDSTGQLSNFIGTSPITSVIDPAQIPVGEWVNVSVSFDGGSGGSNLHRLYVNGTLVASSVVTGSASQVGTLMSFGVKLNDTEDGPALTSNPGWFTGTIAELEFYTLEFLPAPVFAPVSPLLPASMATLGVTGFRAEAEAIQRRLADQRLALPNDIKREWFFDTTYGRTMMDSGTEARSTGALAGAIHSLGDNGYWGFNLGGDTAETNVRSGATAGTEFAGGSFDGQGYRGALYAGVQLADQAFSVDLAVSYASLSGNLTRASAITGNNVADIDAETLGAWFRVSGRGFNAGPVTVSPFAQIESSRTKLKGYTESGSQDYMVVEDGHFDQVAYRVGMALRRAWTQAEWSYNLGVEIAYLDQISDEAFGLTSSQPESGAPSSLTSTAVLPGRGVVVAPYLTIGPDAESSFVLGVRFDQLSNGEGYTYQLGYRRRF